MNAQAEANTVSWEPRAVRTPTVFQLDFMECGAACLNMILSYWGCWVALEDVREACGVSRDGSKASSMVKAARFYGLEAAGVRCELNELDSVALPCILHWGFNHFVVLEALYPGGARINDPARGRRHVSLDELDKSFTGMLLTFTPGPDFVRSGSPSTVLGALRARLHSSHDAALFLLIASALLIVPAAVIPAFTRIFVDDYLIGARADWLRPTLFAFGIAIVVQTLLMWLQRRHMLRLEIKLSCASSQHFLWCLLKCPLQFFSQRLPGDLVNRVAANQRVAQLIAGDLIAIAVGLATVLLFGAVMLTYDIALAAVAVGLGALNFLVTHLIWERQENLARRSLQNQSRLAAITTNGLANIESIKANNGESGFFSLWLAQQAEFITVQQQLASGTLIVNTVPTLLASLGNVVVLGLGAYQIMSGALTIGGLVAFQALMIGFNAPIRDFVHLGTRLRQATADLGRLDDVVRSGEKDMSAAARARTELAPVAESEPHLHKLEGRLDFVAVSFGYNKLEAPFIEDFTLTVQPGTRVAIVGQTGSGKSTLARIAAGLYRPLSGEVLYDGKPLAQTDPSVFTSSVAFVDQDVCVFSGTIRDNISLWDDSLGDESILTATRDACLHETVSMRPNGYLAAVQERGRNLSAGEQQRLEIARALAREPSILILDEATAALDPPVEALIDDNTRRRGCTCLIIAHRLSAIRDCDEIIVLKQGRIVERGTHDSLVARQGEYVRLIQGT